MSPKGTPREAPAEEERRFKEGSAGDGDVPRSPRRRLPNRVQLEFSWKVTRRETPGGSAASREASQSLWNRDPGEDPIGRFGVRADNLMRGGRGEGRSRSSEGENPGGEKAQESYALGEV
jgi:hypothetical protein